MSATAPQSAVTSTLAPTLADTSVAEALRPALLDGATLRAGLAGESAASAQLDGAEGLLRPDVTIGARAETRNTTGSEFSPIVNVSQRLYDGGAARSQITAAEARTRTAQADTTGLVIARAFEALQAWEELHLARELRAIALAATQRYSGFEEQVSRRIAAGAGRNAEALRVASRRDEAAAELARTTGRVEAAEARVRELFGSVPTVGPLPAAPEPSAGFARNPSVVRLDADVEAAEADLAAREAARQPALFLDVFGDLDDFDDPSIGTGLRLEYDLGTNGQRQAAIEAAEAALEQLAADRDLLFEELQREAENTRARQRALQDERGAALRSEEAARGALADAEMGFSGGRFDIFDLLDLGRDLDRAASRRAEVEAVLRLSGYERLSISGELLDVFGIAIEEGGS